MKSRLALLGLVLVSLSVDGCGSDKASAPASRSASSERIAGGAVSSAGVQASSSSAQKPNTAEPVSTRQRSAPVFNPRATRDEDGDDERVEQGGLDRDDDVYILRFGPAAGPADKNAITALIKRYYSALAHEEDSLACSLLFLVLQNLVPETYSQTSRSQKAGQGKTCAAVLSEVYAGHHRELVDENGRLRVVAVRVQGNSALALLRFGPRLVRRVVIYREGAAWKIGTLQANRLG
jgi:hypothetical protein